MLNIQPTPLFSTWVKNVYSLCVEGVVNRVNSSTYTYVGPLSPHSLRVQTPVLPNTMTSFTPFLYTAKLPLFNLLYSHLYTLSTVPTIKKNKKK